MKKKIILVVLIVIVLALIGGAVYYWLAGNKLKVNEYQAVFLDNGQVYFGKVSSQNSQYVTLKDIYYIQVKQPLQTQQKESSDTNTNTDQQQPELTLVKLGKELHGPLDIMLINRDHITFIEDLSADSRVTKAIAEYKAKGTTQ